MSIVNAWIQPDGRSALIAVDTEAIDANGTVQHVSKMVPIVHMPAVVAVRGEATLIPIIVASCLSVRGDFDLLLVELPPRIAATLHTVVTQRAIGVLHQTVTTDLELVVVGWSAQRQRIVGQVYSTRPSGEIDTSEIAPHHLAPWDGSLKGLPAPSTRDAMINMARAQVRLFERVVPTAAGGGELILATLEESGVAIDRVCKLVRVVRAPHG